MSTFSIIVPRMNSMWVLLLLLPTLTLSVEPFHDDLTEPGLLESANYPAPYPAESEYSWSFERESGVWAVIFEDMDIELTKQCKDDYLLIRDASNRKDLIRTCGSKVPRTVISEGRRILISFHSDNMNQGKGFRLRVLHDQTIDALKARLSYEFTTIANVQKDAKSVDFSQEDMMLLSLSLALLVAVLVLICLSAWTIYHHCVRQARPTCCSCGCRPGNKDVVLTMAPMQCPSNHHQGKRYTKPRLKGKQNSTAETSQFNDNKGVDNGCPNVYLPMPDHEAIDQSQCSTLSMSRTDSHRGNQLPMYYTSPQGQIEAPKFIGVM